MYDGTLQLPPRLTTTEEKYILEQLPSQEAQNILVKKNLRLVLYMAKNFEFNGISKEDLLSIGIIGLIKAASTFSIEKKTKFSTYASVCIRNEILMYLESFKKFSTHETSLEITINDEENLNLYDVLSDSNHDSIKLYEDSDFISYLLTVILNHLESKDVVIFLYQLSGKTQQEIGDILLYSRSCISRKLKIIRKKVKEIAYGPKIDYICKISVFCPKEATLVFRFDTQYFDCDELEKFLKEHQKEYQYTILNNGAYISIKALISEEIFLMLAELYSNFFIENN